MQLQLSNNNDKLELALRARRFVDLPELEKRSFVLGLIQRAQIKISSSKGDGEQNAITALEVIKELEENYQWITDQEIELVFNSGVKSEYGDYYGITFKSIFQWIDTYKTTEARKQKLQKLITNQSQPVLTDQEKERKLKEAIRSVFMEYKSINSEGVELLSSAIYDFLKLKGYIKLSAQQTQSYMEEARPILFNTTIAGLGMLQANRLLKNLESGQMNDELIIMAKRLAVRDYFNQIKELPF